MVLTTAELPSAFWRNLMSRSFAKTCRYIRVSNVTAPRYMNLLSCLRFMSKMLRKGIVEGKKKWRSYLLDVLLFYGCIQNEADIAHFLRSVHSSECCVGPTQGLCLRRRAPTNMKSSEYEWNIQLQCPFLEGC
jgi:hypothetical protein